MTPDDFRRIVARPEWMQRAACRGMDPGLFFPELGEPATQAKTVCAGCPVTAECGLYALETGERIGVWGGVDAHARRGLFKAHHGGRVNAAKCGTRSGYDAHKRNGEPPCEACREAPAAYARQRRRRVA